MLKDLSHSAQGTGLGSAACEGSILSLDYLSDLSVSPFEATKSSSLSTVIRQSSF